jgi:hypothetical protein
MTNQDEVRSAVEGVSREVSRASDAGAMGATAGLQASWKRLVELLALGPAPAYRTCPHCGATGMQAATRCGTCWEALTPPAAGPGHAAHRLEPAAKLPVGFDVVAAATAVREVGR